MNVYQYGSDGAPGTRAGDDGLPGGDGQAALAINTGNGSDQANVAYAGGGRGGLGGGGADNLAGTGGAGGAGGAGGGATARAVITLAAAGLLDATARARGGSGGLAGRPGNAGGVATPAGPRVFPPVGEGADGGAGGDASAEASSINPDAVALAASVAVGGGGGTGYGAGHRAGAAGTASATATAIGVFAARASVFQVGGSGGYGRGGATASSGAASTAVNAVTGRTDGGDLDLIQYALGGRGGAAGAAGRGGAGGAGTSRLTFDDALANSTTSSLIATRSEAAGGNGGGGGTGGGDGATAEAAADIAGAHELRVQVRAVGGSGGDVAGDPAVVEGDGGAGGGATATGRSASSARAGEGPSGSYVRAEAVGGAGGRALGASGTGHAGGAGGTAAATASANGDGAYAYAVGRGGQGGAGIGADGGAGGSVAMQDAVTGTTYGGSLRLKQMAFGGAGGATVLDGHAGGAGGAARSALVFDDTKAAVAASSLTGLAMAYGGAGGDAPDPVEGATGLAGVSGAGFASVTLTGRFGVGAYSRGSGGAAAAGTGLANPAGGAGTAISNAISTGASGTALAQADAAAGLGERGPSAPPVGQADATATARTAAGGLARAVATAEGTSGLSQASATTSGAGVVTAVTATASTPADGRTITEARAQAGGIELPSFFGLDVTAYSYATILPPPGFVSFALGNNPGVDAAFGTPAADVFAAGVMGVSSNMFRTTPSGYSSTMDWTLDTTGATGHLVMGLLDPLISGTGPFTLNLRVSIEGELVVNRSFSSLLPAALFAHDNPLDLGEVAHAPDLSVSVSLTMSGEPPFGNGFGIAYLLGFTDQGLDTTRPRAPTLALGPASDSGRSSTDRLTNIAAPLLTGLAEPNSRLTVFDGTTALGSVVVAANAAWSLLPGTPLAEGTHALTATSTDLNGNVSLASPVLNLTIDTTAPVTPAAPNLLAGSDIGLSAADNITSDTSPLLGGRTEAGATVIVLDGAIELGRTQAGALGAWAFRATLLDAGVHSLTVRAEDAAGNTTIASAPLTLTIDIAAPDAPGTPDLARADDSGRSATDDVTNITTPLFTGRADPGGRVTLFDGDAEIGSGAVGALGNWAVRASALAAGTHAITAIVTDAAGNASGRSAALSVTIDIAGPAAPATPDLAAASDTGVSATDNLTRDTTPLFTGRAAGAARVTLFDGDTEIGSGAVGELGNWAVRVAPLAPGAHAITARVADAAGNLGDESSAVVVTIDTTAPAAPTAPDLVRTSDNGRSGTDNRTSVTTPLFVGKAEVGGQVTLLDGATVLGASGVGALGNWAVRSTPLAVGVHQVRAVMIDAAGNASADSAALEVTIAAAPPLSATVQALRDGVDPGALRAVAASLDPLRFVAVTGGEGYDVLAGPDGAATLFRGTAAGLDGDTILDFGADDAIAVTDLLPGAVLAYEQGAVGGTLSVSDGSHAARITLEGVYEPAGFRLTADAEAGGRIAYALT